MIVNDDMLTVVSPLPGTPLHSQPVCTVIHATPFMPSSHLCTPVPRVNEEQRIRTPNTRELDNIFAKYDNYPDMKTQHRWQQLHLMTPEGQKNNITIIPRNTASFDRRFGQFEQNNPESPDLTTFIGMIDVDLRDNEAKNLNQQERRQLNDLLQQHQSVFAESGSPTTVLEHRINIGDNQPVATSPYRLPPLKRQQLKIELDEMLRQHIIEESDSPFASPVVMIPKKDGSTRVCIDYRRLNEITVPDQYPMPRIDDLLHEANSSSFMSTIDLRSGYWQIGVREHDQEKTAFITPFGLYEFKRMPFGLRNAPATFQRLMNLFRNGLPNLLLLAYLDDLIVISNNLTQHLDDLRNVFKRLKLFCLRAHRDKCHFACQKVKYLGHILTPLGIQMDPEKIEAIQNRPPPQNVKQAMSFIQTCSWYRRFVANFAEVIQPLTQLTRKNVKWTWGPEQQSTFETMKTLLTSAPILAQADESLPFIIKTDASGYALGAVLVQGRKKMSIR